MSTILKALRRLEDEKSEQARASLEENLVAPGRGASPSGRSGARIWVASALAAGAAAAFVLAVMWSPGRRAPALPIAASASSSASAAAPVAPPVVAAAPAAPAPLAVARPPAAAPPPPPVAQLPAEPAAPRAAPAPAVAVLRPEPKRAWLPEPEPLVAPEPEAVSAPAPVAVRAPAPVAAPKPVVAAREPAPPLADVAVLRTVWHPRSDRRTAEVKLGARSQARVLREGDSLGPLVLLEISPSGVTFEQDGRLLKRKIGDVR